MFRDREDLLLLLVLEQNEHEELCPKYILFEDEQTAFDVFLCVVSRDEILNKGKQTVRDQNGRDDADSC